jgi:hypothetical protein
LASSGAGQPGADALGEIRGLIGGLGDGIDEGAPLELPEGHKKRRTSLHH